MISAIRYRHVVAAWEEIEHKTEKSGVQVSTALSIIGDYIADTYSDDPEVKKIDHERYERSKK